MIIFTIGALLTTGGVYACGSSGCCQRMPPPPVASCGGGGGGGCQPGYRCGPYGCARVRALAGITRRMDGVLVKDEEDRDEAYNSIAEGMRGEKSQAATVLRYSNLTMERLTNPNFIFRACCESRGLPDSCVRKCNYNAYTAQALERMYSNEDECPIHAANEIQYCAAQGIDHSECCTENGVGDTTAGNKCVRLCDQTPNRFTELDFSFMPCFEAFESMKRCFFTEVKKRAALKFGEGKKKQRKNYLNDGGSVDMQEEKQERYPDNQEISEKGPDNGVQHRKHKI